jgi:branched-chain amino acid transport system ATP-binding protein
VTDTLLAVEGLSVRYGQALALSNVDVQIGQGEVVAILGSNGAGKSTLGAAVSGLVKPSAGRIRFEGHDVTGWPAHRRARRGIAHVPEQHGVFTGLTVMDNLRASVVRRKRSEQRESIDRAFSLFPVLSQRSRQQAGTLSGGERQMLALARVLASPPRLLVADEMSLGLAPMLVAEVFAGLKRVRDEGVAVLLVEQFVDRAVDLADRALILRRGEVVWQGPADAASGDIVSHYLGAAGVPETELGASAS